MNKILLLLICSLYSFQSQAQELNYQPKILLITAHPDDDVISAVTTWKTTKLLNGTVDLALMTNGEGGYKYSTLGNYIYDLELDNEEVGRANLPEIRKKELKAGGDIVGIRNYYFFDRQDFYYTTDVQETFDKWETETIVTDLIEIIETENYDFVFLLLPNEGNHGHHVASSILGLNAIDSMDEGNRPIALFSTFRRGESDPGREFIQLEGYPITKVMEGEIFEFNRNQTFGFNDRMNYNIISNWVIAEHKSQGTMQMLSQSYDGLIEQYWYAEMNGTDGLEKTRQFFEAINAVRPD